MFRRWMLIAVATVGTMLTSGMAEAAKYPIKNQAVSKVHQSHVPTGYYDTWGNYVHFGYGFALPYNYPSSGYPHSAGPYYYENPTFGFYANPRFVSPFVGVDLLY